MGDFNPLEIERASGCELHTTDGRTLLDGVSNLWCNVLGHSDPRVVNAITDQLHRVPHITTLGMSCQTTNQLADRLGEITPAGLNHSFFSSDGASAVEAAIKMAFQFWQQCDSPKPNKTRFLALGNAYHGDTTAGVSLGGIRRFHQIFGPILFSPLRGPVPSAHHRPAELGGRPVFGHDLHDQELCDHYLTEYEKIFQSHHHELAALVMEPLVQGAAGMVTQPIGFLAGMRELCDRYDVLMIVDEVATGFTRTGKWFACEHENVSPDILCLGKGLTGGWLPLSATLATSKIYDAFLGGANEGRQFYHGHTFGGNPMAAASALATIDAIESDEIVCRSNDAADRLRSTLGELENCDFVSDIRGRGLMVGIELVKDRQRGEPFDPNDLMGQRVCDEAIRRGVYLRPISDVVIVMPPPVMEDQQLDRVAEVVVDSIKSVCKNEG